MPARRARDGGGHERPGREREPGLQRAVAPHAGQEQDVRERVAVEAGRGDDRHAVGGAERADAQQPQVDDRRAVPGAAPDEDRRRAPAPRRRRRAHARCPSPTRSPSRRRAPARRSPARTAARPSRSGIRRRPGRAALDQLPAGQHDRGHADRQVDEEHQAPVGQPTRACPPSDGPSPAAAAATADSSATPWARRSGGNAFSTSASDAGTRKAAPSACTIRNADQRRQPTAPRRTAPRRR